MKKKFLATIVATGAILSGCSGDKAANNSNGGGESTMTGVAAVGAPIANGFVEVKGANGTIVSATTSASGVYNVGLGSLASPYLVRVTSPTGQRYFTVASKEDVSASKKINITPITHTIIANVFKDKSPDTLFENFTTKSNEYSQSAVNLAKNDFKQKMIDAGVLGSAGILTDTEIDLMNGSFVAGSGAGVDKLLDALDIDVEKGASNIEVNLKSGQKIYSNDVSDPTKPVTILDLSAAITATNSQLVLLGKIKESLNNINKIFKTVALCSGPAVVGGSCDKDTLNTRVEGILHADYKYSGLNRTVDSWSYFCSEEEVDGDKEATNSESCNFINSIIPTFADVVVLDLKDNSEATIQYALYINGKFEGTSIEKIALGLDDTDINDDKNSLDQVWKIKGNQLDYDYFFEPLSLHKTIISSDKTEQIYEAQIQLYTSGITASLGTDVSLRAINKDKSANTALNLALSGSSKVELISEANSSMLLVKAKQYRDSASGVVGATQCGTCVVNFDANKISLNASALENMDAVQRFELEYTTGGGVKTETIYIRRPMKITASNASSLVPNFSSANICESLSASYPITKPADHDFIYGSVFLYSNDGSGSVSLPGNQYIRGDSSIEISGIGNSSGKVLNFGYFNISSQDQLGRMFSRDIECK